MDSRLTTAWTTCRAIATWAIPRTTLHTAPPCRLSAHRGVCPSLDLPIQDHRKDNSCGHRRHARESIRGAANDEQFRPRLLTWRRFLCELASRDRAGADDDLLNRRRYEYGPH